MGSAPGYLIDTNVLLRLSHHDDLQHLLVKTALDQLDRQGLELYYSMQNIAEFWNVSTRPTEQNGYGLSISETNSRLAAIELIMSLLPDNKRVYSNWRQLVIDHEVRGVQVHDARLVAVMQAYGLPRILTLNDADFARYTAIQAIHPSQVAATTP